MTTIMNYDKENAEVLTPTEADKINSLIDRLNAELETACNKSKMPTHYLIGALASVLASTINALDLDTENTMEILHKMINDFHSGNLGHKAERQ